MRRGVASRNRLKMLIHEWAHELLHHGSAEAQATTKGIKECHAEAMASVVCSHFGLHNPFSSDYVQSWGADAATLLAELATVQKAATTIITALEATENDPSEAADAQYFGAKN
jgi:hypothetical protein